MKTSPKWMQASANWKIIFLIASALIILLSVSLFNTMQDLSNVRAAHANMHTNWLIARNTISNQRLQLRLYRDNPIVITAEMADAVWRDTALGDWRLKYDPRP